MARLVFTLVSIMSITLTASPANSPNADQLSAMAARFEPTPLRVDLSHLSQGDRAALATLMDAGRQIDFLFMEQLWSGNSKLYRELQADRSPLGRARFHLFWISKGPWFDLDEHRAFLPDVPERKTLSSTFYPADMSKTEFERWVAKLPEQEAMAAKSFFTVIRRHSTTDQLLSVPYAEAYARYLKNIASLLRKAARETGNASLKRFLELRAQAFLDNDYYASDLAWMDMDAPIDVTIGPYETYNDEMFGYKASFEAYICLKDEEASNKLKSFASHLQDVEDNLPIEPRYRNPKLSAQMPIHVVNELLSAGDGNHGVQTAAYNLPNDERVVQQKGSKKIMLKNVQHAKFDATLLPIAKISLATQDQDNVSFDWFFTHILAHEISHGIGPHEIAVAGRKTAVRLELKDLYSTIEEAKADITGLFMIQHFFDRGVLPGGDLAESQVYTTFLASSFRTLRFGITEAHGRGMALQFNYLLDRGAFVGTQDGRFAVDKSKMKQGVRELTRDLLTIEARGDYQAAKEMLDKYGVIRRIVKQTLDRMTQIPIDIEPQFVTADEVAPPKQM